MTPDAITVGSADLYTVVWYVYSTQMTKSEMRANTTYCANFCLDILSSSKEPEGSRIRLI